MFFFNVDNLKNSPVLNAINAKAISGRNAIPCITFWGIKLRQYGPMRIPVMMYAVTLGSFNFFVILVIKKARNNIKAIEMMIAATSLELIAFFMN